MYFLSRCTRPSSYLWLRTGLVTPLLPHLQLPLNTLMPKQNCRHLADDIFKCIFLNENVWIFLKISPKFVSKVRIHNIPALVQIMAWRRPGAKPLSEPMMVSLLMHICATRPQWALLPQSCTKLPVYTRPNIYPLLIQIMACRLVGAKPLSEPMLQYLLVPTWCCVIKVVFIHRITIPRVWVFCRNLNL